MTRERLIRELRNIDNCLQGIGQSIAIINGKQEKEKDKEKDGVYQQYQKTH